MKIYWKIGKGEFSVQRGYLPDTCRTARYRMGKSCVVMDNSRLEVRLHAVGLIEQIRSQSIHCDRGWFLKQHAASHSQAPSNEKPITNSVGTKREKKKGEEF